MSAKGNKLWFVCVFSAGAKYGYEPRDNEVFVGGGDIAGVDWSGGGDAAGDRVGEAERDERGDEPSGGVGRALCGRKGADVAACSAGNHFYGAGATTVCSGIEGEAPGRASVVGADLFDRERGDWRDGADDGGARNHWRHG